MKILSVLARKCARVPRVEVERRGALKRVAGPFAEEAIIIKRIHRGVALSGTSVRRRQVQTVFGGEGGPA